MLNDTLFNELVEASRDLPGNRWSVGGNAPVMAGRMATEGCDVLLGGSFSPDFADVLSQHITGTHRDALVDPYNLLGFFRLLMVTSPNHFPAFLDSYPASFYTSPYSSYFSTSSALSTFCFSLLSSLLPLYLPPLCLCSGR